MKGSMCKSFLSCSCRSVGTLTFDAHFRNDLAGAKTFSNVLQLSCDYKRCHRVFGSWEMFGTAQCSNIWNTLYMNASLHNTRCLERSLPLDQFHIPLGISSLQIGLYSKTSEHCRGSAPSFYDNKHVQSCIQSSFWQAIACQYRIPDKCQHGLWQ